ncbi:hypothetical protein MRB53_040721 [Persea americana]|nr:hypothetical protein MRB53_040721 [Persea americana]
MQDFLYRFHNEGYRFNPDPFNTTPYPGAYAFSNVRTGLIVGLLSIGTLIGAIVNGAIIFWNVIFIVGAIVQISTTFSWVQISLGRLVAGLGVGGLSVLTPMLSIRDGAEEHQSSLGVSGAYQLFITAGIWVAYAINYGTYTINGPASWRITVGISFVWPVLMAVGICFLPESPRWDFRHGNTERARQTIAWVHGVSENHKEVVREMREIQEKLDAENAGGGKHPWYEVFTGPRMAYRTLLGMTLQMLQQLTGANFFFYFVSFEAASVLCSLTKLRALQFSKSTFVGLWVVQNVGRRRALITGSIWMFVCFMIYASVGHFLLQQGKHTQAAGYVLIIFTALFIFGYAITWAPIVWALVGEIYPSRYRAKSMGFATASNWTWNFLLAFFTAFIVNDIDYRYGYVFAGANFAGAFVVYFFVCESQGRSLEEIDTMYVMHVPPWKSRNWVPPQGETLGETDAAYLTPGGRDIRKRRTNEEQREHVTMTESNVAPIECRRDRDSGLDWRGSGHLIIAVAGQDKPHLLYVIALPTSLHRSSPLSLPSSHNDTISHSSSSKSSFKPPQTTTMATINYLPPVKPSAIALGAAYSHAISLAVMGSPLGDAYTRAQKANSSEEFFKSREAASAAASWGSSIVGSCVQAYGMGALINATGTLSQKGAAYLGLVVFMASSAPSLITQFFVEARPTEAIVIGGVSRAFRDSRPLVLAHMVRHAHFSILDQYFDVVRWNNGGP